MPTDPSTADEPTENYCVWTFDGTQWHKGGVYCNPGFECPPHPEGKIDLSSAKQVKVACVPLDTPIDPSPGQHPG